MAIFHEGELMHSAILPVGARRVTEDLAILLKTTIDRAERIKLELGVTSEADDRRRRDQLDLSAYLDDDTSIARRDLVRAIDARMDDLMKLVKKELDTSGYAGHLPSGVVLSGGGSLLPGFPMLVKNTVRLAVRMSRPMNVDASIDTALDPAYAVCVGLVVWGFGREEAHLSKPGPKIQIKTEWVKKVFGWLKNFAP